MEEVNYADMLDVLNDFRKKIMSTAPKNRDIKIYHKRFDKRDVPHFVFDMDKELDQS